MRNVNIVLFLFLSNSFVQCHSGNTNNISNYKSEAKYWDLKTGSHIAYLHVPAVGTANAVPLIFLHGGPGACQVNSFGKEAPVEWYNKLANNNYDVYVYDQVGSGLSDRLNDPTQYTVERHVSDLEEIRIIIGNKQCVLIGDSWGATLASHYMAKYPQNVIKAIFTSPGYIDIRDWTDEYSSVPRFLSGWYDWIGYRYGEELLIRYYGLDKLMQTDVHKAYDFAGDEEMDQLADEFISAEIFKTCVYHKAFTKSPEFKMEGMGWWSSVMTIFNLINIKPIKNILEQNNTPVLILRGEADYLEPGIANQYTSVFPDSKLIRVPKAGHFIWLDQPSTYQHEIENFLIK